MRGMPVTCPPFGLGLLSSPPPPSLDGGYPMPPYATVCAGCRLPAPVVRARLLLDGAFGTDRAPNPAASPPSIREDFEKDPRPRACLSYRVSAPSEDIHNFCRHTATQRRTLIPAPRPPFWRIQRSHLVRDKVIPNPEEDLVASAHHRLPKALRPRHASEKMNPGPVADTEKVHPIQTPPPTPHVPPEGTSASQDRHSASRQRSGFRDRPP